MEFIGVLKTRRSVRAYRPDPIPDEVLKNVLEHMRFAPSANNTQPWHFVVVKDAAKRRELVKAAYGHSFIGEAPVVIICCGKRYHDEYSWIGDNMYLVDCAIAIDHLTLAARNAGLGTCWIGAFDHAAVKRLAKLPAGYDMLMLMPIGYPAHENAFHETSARKPLDQIVSGL